MIHFSKNAVHCGAAFTLEQDYLTGRALFPCVSAKGMSFSVNFGGALTWCEVEGMEKYLFVQQAKEEHRVAGPQVR